MANVRGPDARPLKVLIADDSPAVAEMLAQLVSEPGKVEVVGSTESEERTLESVRRLMPDVLASVDHLRSQRCVLQGS